MRSRSVFSPSALVILLIACFSITKMAAQEQAVVKECFIIHANDPHVNTQKYFDASNNYGQLDQFRFYDQRRFIKFTDADVTIELYSAKELLEKYGKQISPQTIMQNQQYKSIEFTVTPDGKSIKPQVVN